MTPLIIAPTHHNLLSTLHTLNPSWHVADNTPSFSSSLQAAFLAKQPLVAICATGIIIRILAPFLSDKYAESPVIVIDPQGQHVIPLLGGHHGANTLARHIAENINAQAIITTASSHPLDTLPHEWHFNSPQKHNTLRKNSPNPSISHDFLSPHTHTSIIPATQNINAPEVPDILVTDKLSSSSALLIHPPSLVLGIGSIRNASPPAVLSFVLSILKDNHIATKSIAALATHSLKAHEPALHSLAQYLSIPIRTFSPETLSSWSHTYSLPPNDTVQKEVGTPSVSEAAALALASTSPDTPDAHLVIPKHISPHATLALAAASQPLSPSHILSSGNPVGHIYVVGTGPGHHQFLTQDALTALHNADTLIGYDLYLSLITPFSSQKNILSFPLGKETERTKAAIEKAHLGHRVALVCSGDPAVYALATLVLESLEKDTRPSPPLSIHPGITAMSMASSRCGAILGHDFCAISLSNLLTPQNTILSRVEHAAKADLVIAFYNPQSKTRKTLLPKSLAILRSHRPPHTPIILARNLTRHDENISLHSLENFPHDLVDMFSIVIIGNSTSRTLPHIPSMPHAVFTPRGYDSKDKG